MTVMSTDILDAALVELAEATLIHICSAEPADYAAVAGVSLGSAACSVGAPAGNGTLSRKATVAAVTAGTVTANGTATHYAIVDGSRLLVAKVLQASKAVVTGSPWTMGAFDIPVTGA